MGGDAPGLPQLGGNPDMFCRNRTNSANWTDSTDGAHFDRSSRFRGVEFCKWLSLHRSATAFPAPHRQSLCRVAGSVGSILGRRSQRGRGLGNQPYPPCRRRSGRPPPWDGVRNAAWQATCSFAECRDQGYVTSVAKSFAWRGLIGLGLLVKGRKRQGRVARGAATSPIRGVNDPVTVIHSVFAGRSGARQA